MSFTEKLSYDRSLIPDNLPERDEGGADFRIGFLDFGGPGMYTQDWVAEELTGDVLNDAVFNRNAAVEERFNIKISMVSHPNDNYSTAFTSTVIAGGRRVRYGVPASRPVQLVYAVGTLAKALGS
ncbi:MAG: hypothetical protein E7576_00180 [Ruminococcaceae bacterium]|jgi:hypothetical protein|nr:hypothetical protein [Oscillospiraceae bacterium]